MTRKHYNGAWRPEDGFIVVTSAVLPTVDRVVQRPTSFTWAHKLKTAVGSTAVPGGRGVCGCWFAVIADFDPAGGMAVRLL